MTTSNPNNNSNKPNTNLPLIAIISVVAITVFGITLFTMNTNTAKTDLVTNTNSSQVSSTKLTSSLAPSSIVVSKTGSYKDGQYTTTQDYKVPGDTNSLQITLTLQNDLVTDVTAVNTIADKDSSKYDNNFKAAYKAAAVGKNLKDLNSIFISGASLTSGAFQKAIADIQNQAK
jgi:uncharacterized protein with FMN-binding domain